MDEKLAEKLRLKNKYALWILPALFAAAASFADTYLGKNLLSGILFPLTGIFLGPAGIAGAAVGTGIGVGILDRDLSCLLWAFSAFWAAFLPWLLRKFIRDITDASVLLKYYLVILLSAVPAIALLAIYYETIGETEFVSYTISMSTQILCLEFAVGFPLYYLIRGLLDKNLKSGKFGLRAFCVYMPLQLLVSRFFASEAYDIVTISDIYKAWKMVNLVLFAFFTAIAFIVWLSCKRKRLTLNLFTIILAVSAVYNIISFDAGIGTFLLIILALWFGLHSIFFYPYEKRMNSSRIFKTLVRSAQAVIICILLLVIALQAATYAIPRANGDEAGMIILGAPVRDNKATEILQDRIVTAADFLNKYDEILVIATGGTKVAGRKTEALVITEGLTSRGISAERIFQETAAKTTRENFSNCAKIITEYGASTDDEFIITTSNFHLLRSAIHARNAGFTHTTYLGSPSILAKSLTWYIREAFAILPLILLNG